MSLDPQTTQEISDNIVAQLETSFNQTIPLLPRAFIRVLAKVLGGVFVLLFKYAGFMFLQMFVQSASINETTVLGRVIQPLIFWGRLIGVGDPTAATNAELTATITVENQTGVLPANSQGLNASNGVTYVTTADVALNAATVTVNFRAVQDQGGGGGAGVIGNLLVGDIISFANPLPNVARDTTVTAVVTTAANAEDTEVYRQRIINKFQARPQGGASSDYRIWSTEVAGIINAYPYTSQFPGQINVYCEATEASSGSADGIPTSAQLQAVLDNIALDSGGVATRQPLGPLVNTLPITRTEFAVEVSGLTVDNSTQVQADITEAVQTYFIGLAPFVSGLDVLPRLDQISPSAVGGVVNDIVAAAGGVFNGVVVREGGTPLTLRTLGEGEKSKATVSFVA